MWPHANKQSDAREESFAFHLCGLCVDKLGILQFFLQEQRMLLLSLDFKSVGGLADPSD